MENKILITGGNGLVGSEFKGEQYYKPSSKDYNLVDKMAINFDTNFLDDFEYCIFKSIEFWKSTK